MLKKSSLIATVYALLFIFLSSSLQAQCIQATPGFASVNCNTGTIDVSGIILSIDATCLFSNGSSAFATVFAFDDAGGTIMDNLIVNGSLSSFNFPMQFTGNPLDPNVFSQFEQYNINVFSIYFNGLQPFLITSYYDINTGNYLGSDVPSGMAFIFQTSPITIPFTPGCSAPMMPLFDFGMSLAAPPIIPCNAQPDATFTIDKTSVLPGELVTVNSLAMDPNTATGNPYVLEQVHSLTLNQTFSNCTPGTYSIDNTALYPGITADACPQAFSQQYTVTDYPTDAPTIVEMTCAGGVVTSPGVVTAPTHPDFTWVYTAEPGYDNCVSVTYTGHWEVNGCMGPDISVSTNPSPCVPTITNTAGSETICHGGMPTLPTITFDGTDFLQAGSEGWYVGGAPGAGGTQPTSYTNETCATLDVVLTAYAVSCNGTVITGPDYTVTVYPNPANFEVTYGAGAACGDSPTVTVGSCATMTTNAVTTAHTDGCSGDIDTNNDPVDGVYTIEQAAHPDFPGAPACFVLPALVNTTVPIVACDNVGCVGCPTVTTPASGSATICHNEAAPAFPTITLSSGVEGTDYTITWSPATIITTNETCAPVTTTYTPTIICVADGSTISGGGSFDVTVYPNPANFEVTYGAGAACGDSPTVTVGSCATMTTNAVTTAHTDGCSGDIDTNNDPIDGVYTIEQAAHPDFPGAPACFVLPALVNTTVPITACDNVGCIGTVVSVNADNTDPCFCVAPPALDADNMVTTAGVLGDQMVITTTPATPGLIWNVTAGANTTITSGPTATDNTDGTYTINVEYTDNGAGWSVTATPGAGNLFPTQNGAGGTSCSYEVGSFPDLDVPQCAGATVSGATPADGTYSPTTISAPAPGSGASTVPLTYTYDSFRDTNDPAATGCPLILNATANLPACPVCGASPNMQWIGN